MVDLIYGARDNWLSRDSFSSVISTLEGRGREVKKIRKRHVDGSKGTIAGLSKEELDDVPVLYRRKRGFEGESILRELEELSRPEITEDGRFLQGPNILPNSDVRGSDNKSLGKENLEARKIPFVPSYDTETAKAVHEAGHYLMEKPEAESLGRGVNPIKPDDDFSPDPDKIYEPLIKHHDENSPWVERRAVGFAGKYSQGVFAAKDRVLKQRDGPEDYRSMNISNGNGAYDDFDPVKSPFTFEDASFVLEAIQANGGGAQGVDYLYNRETGQRLVIETNSTVNISGVRKASHENINSYAADILEKEIDGERFYGMTENLEGFDFDDSNYDPDDMENSLSEISWTPEHISNEYVSRPEMTPETQYSGNTAQPVT